jgi:hypothetical protein
MAKTYVPRAVTWSIPPRNTNARVPGCSTLQVYIWRHMPHTDPGKHWNPATPRSQWGYGPFWDPSAIRQRSRPPRVHGEPVSPVGCIVKTQGKASNLTVSTHPKPPPSEPTPASDDSAPTSGAAGAPLAGPTPVPTCPESACLENDCALTNYANALDKLWER